MIIILYVKGLFQYALQVYAAVPAGLVAQGSLCQSSQTEYRYQIKHVNRFHYDFLLAQYLNCSKMADGHFFPYC